MSQLPWVKNPKRYAIFFFKEQKAMQMQKSLFVAFLGHFFLPLHGQHLKFFFDN